jgi:hypothetical protein
MNAIDRLLAIEDIKQLKARYFRALDTRDMDVYGATFTDDAQIDVRGVTDSTSTGDGEAMQGFDEGAVFVGGRAFAEFVSEVVKTIRTAHHGHMPEIEIQSATTARGVWAMEDHIWFAPGAPHRMLHGYGHYHETYRKVDGVWLIASMTITRLRVDLG